MNKSIFTLIFTLFTGIYGVKAQLALDTIKQIDKQKIACSVKEISTDVITYEILNSENKTNITIPIEQIESIKWANGKITFINSTEGDITNNLSMQLANLDSVFYKTGETYNNKYNPNLYSTGLIFYSSLLFSGAATMTPCLIAYFTKPNPTYYHGPNELVKKNKSFQAGYTDAATKVKKSTIAYSWGTGSIMNILMGLMIYQIINNR